MNLEQTIDKWAKSKSGKQRLKDAVKVKLASSTSKAAKSQVHASEFYGKEFRRILNEVMTNSLGYSYEDYIREIYSYQPKKDGTEIQLTFDPEKIRRSSLQPDRYSDGAYDIVALLNHGYEANGAVYGYWESAGKVVRSLTAREGVFFIQKAVEQFNALYGPVAKAYYNEKYD